MARSSVHSLLLPVALSFGGGTGDASDRWPCLLVDEGEPISLRHARSLRDARPRALLFVVASPSARVHRRLDVLARIGVDDVFFASLDEEHRLVDKLRRVRQVQVKVDPRVVDAPAAEVPGYGDPDTDRILVALHRDPSPPWRVTAFLDQLRMPLRRAERRLKAAGLPPMRVLLQERIVSLAIQLHDVDMSWHDVADALGAPSVQALQMRVLRARQRPKGAS